MSIFLIGIPVLLYLYYDNKYTITPNRVIAQYGILSKREFSARKNQITDIYTTQGVVARLMGVGDVVINTAGTSAYEVKFKGVANPTEIKERLLRSFGE
jgi:uncharacterized membrane protein YdbT with pleckstrin-like domain